MATGSINGVRLFYDIRGRGHTPLVLVHGSWTSHHSWDVVVPRLANTFRTVTYDRRGHSESERPVGRQGSVREDAADLAALIEHLDLAPAFLAANSFGASIALRFAGSRPDLVRGLVAHEPPLFHLLQNDPDSMGMLSEVGQRVGAVVERITNQDHAGAAEQFVETVALGTGSWAKLSPEIQRTMIENAPTFLDEARDPEALTLDLNPLRALDRPVLLTTGEKSPPTFAPVVRKLAETLPRAEVLSFEGAGHIPQVTHPGLYVEVVTAFVRNHPTG